jgi:hypothetical protein
MVAGKRKSKIDYAVDALGLALAVAIVITPSVVPPCSHQLLTTMGATVPMRCHWTFQVVSLLGGANTLGALGLLFAPRGSRRRTTAEFVALLAVLTVLTTQDWVVGLCGHSEMACHTTAHWVWLWSLLLVGTAVYVRFWGRERVIVAGHGDPWDALPGTGKAAL